MEYEPSTKRTTKHLVEYREKTISRLLLRIRAGPSVGRPFLGIFLLRSTVEFQKIEWKRNFKTKYTVRFQKYRTVKKAYGLFYVIFL